MYSMPAFLPQPFINKKVYNMSEKAVFMALFREALDELRDDQPKLAAIHATSRMCFAKLYEIAALYEKTVKERDRLAIWIRGLSCSRCPAYKCPKIGCKPTICLEHILEWAAQEAD